MTYDQALKHARRVGAVHAKGDALLAQNCSLVPYMHPGVNPAMLYDGAKKSGVDPDALLKMDGAALCDVLFA